MYTTIKSDIFDLKITLLHNIDCDFLVVFLQENITPHIFMIYFDKFPTICKERRNRIASKIERDFKK